MLACRRKRRKKSSIESCSPSSTKNKRGIEDNDSPDADVSNLRTVGRSNSFKPDDIFCPKSNEHMYIDSTSYSNKMIIDGEVALSKMSTDRISIFRSAKKLQFSTDEFDRDDDFQINNFSPNDEGPKNAPLHIFEHHGIKKKLIITPVDEAMMEEDCQESPPLVDNGTNKYFGGFTLVAPSQKLH